MDMSVKDAHQELPAVSSLVRRKTTLVLPGERLRKLENRKRDNEMSDGVSCLHHLLYSSTTK